MELEAPRARRRRLTETVARRRHCSYVTRFLDGDPSGHRWASTSPYYWSKQGTCCCRCRKRRHGAPRLDKGMCDHGARRRVYRLRALTLELNRLVLRGEDVEADAVALLASNNLRGR